MPLANVNKKFSKTKLFEHLHNTLKTLYLSVYLYTITTYKTCYFIKIMLEYFEKTERWLKLWI